MRARVYHIDENGTIYVCHDGRAHLKLEKAKDKYRNFNGRFILVRNPSIAKCDASCRRMTIKIPYEAEKLIREFLEKEEEIKQVSKFRYVSPAEKVRLRD